MSTQPATTDNTSLSLSAIAGFLKDLPRRRSQRLALRELLTMGPHRLDDLGIDLGNVVEAIRCLSSAGRILEDRRAARAIQATTSAKQAPHPSSPRERTRS